MNKKKPIQTEEELVEAFDQLFDETPPPQTPEEVNDYIREAGIDPDEFGAKTRMFSEKALHESPLNWRNRGQEEIEQARTALERIEWFAGKSRSELQSIIDTVMGHIAAINPSLNPVHYRNRHELTDEDLASLLQELMFIAGQYNIELDIGE